VAENAAATKTVVSTFFIVSPFQFLARAPTILNRLTRRELALTSNISDHPDATI
jgi:hypothetical protein